MNKVLDPDPGAICIILDKHNLPKPQQSGNTNSHFRILMRIKCEILWNIAPKEKITKKIPHSWWMAETEYKPDSYVQIMWSDIDTTLPPHTCSRPI